MCRRWRMALSFASSRSWARRFLMLLSWLFRGGVFFIGRLRRRARVDFLTTFFGFFAGACFFLLLSFLFGFSFGLVWRSILWDGLDLGFKRLLTRLTSTRFSFRFRKRCGFSRRAAKKNVAWSKREIIRAISNVRLRSVKAVAAAGFEGEVGRDEVLVRAVMSVQVAVTVAMA